MTKGPIIFLFGVLCGDCAALLMWGCFHPSGAGVIAIITGLLGAVICTFVAGEIDTRKDGM